MSMSKEAQAKVDLIVRLYLNNQNFSSKDIADIVSCHSGYVRAVIRRRGYVGFENRRMRNVERND